MIFALLIAALIHALPHAAVAPAPKPMLQLRGPITLGERFTQGAVAVEVLGLSDDAKRALLRVTDLRTGKGGDIVVADNYCGPTQCVTFDQTTLCTTSGTTGLCNPVLGAQTFSGAITLSAAGTALTVNNNALVSGTLTVTTNIVDSALTASKCVGSDASKNLVSATNCQDPIAVTAPITNGGTATDPNIGCTTCVTTAGGQTIGSSNETFSGTVIHSAVTAAQYNDGGTACTGAVQCFAQTSTTNNGSVASVAATAASTDSYSFDNNTVNGSGSTCTNANSILAVKKTGTKQLQALCNGDLLVGTGSTGNVVTQASSGGKGEVGTNGATCGTTTQCTGAIVAGALARFMYGTNCAQATSNASPSLVTLNEWHCTLTSGSASATVFTITYPGSVTLTNKPHCIYTDFASGITTEPTCIPGLSSVVVTYAVAPGAVAIGDLILIGNGP
jgi:hypothetical protein